MFSIELRAIWGFLKGSILWKEVITRTQFLGKATGRWRLFCMELDVVLVVV